MVTTELITSVNFVPTGYFFIMSITLFLLPESMTFA